MLALFTAWLDWRTGLGLRLGPLYVIPAGLIAWRFGRLAGVLSSLVLTATWYSLEFWHAARRRP